jgi:hypothetical protein
VNLLRLCVHPAAKMCTLELAGLAQHEGKGPCRKSPAKNEQKRQAKTLFDVGLKRAKNIPTITPAAAGSSESARKDLKAPSPVVVVKKHPKDSERKPILAVQWYQVNHFWPDVAILGESWGGGGSARP